MNLSDLAAKGAIPRSYMLDLMLPNSSSPYSVKWSVPGPSRPLAALASLVASVSRLALFWRNIDWQVVRWYQPGAVVGAMGVSRAHADLV